MANRSSHRAIAISIYVLLLGALLSTTVLICGCVPISSGQDSILKSFATLRINVPGRAVHQISISSFALCANLRGTISCATSAGKTTSDLLLPLYGPQNPSFYIRPLETALKLQQKVFFGSPTLEAFLFFFALVCAFGSRRFPDPYPRLLKITASVSASLATAIILVEDYTTRLVLSALEIANASASASIEDGLEYEVVAYWEALHWMGFAFGLLGAGLLAWLAYVETCGADENRGVLADHSWRREDDGHELGVRQPMLPHGGQT